MIRAWRLVKAEFAAQALDGLGAARFGGRWNSPGRRMVYLGGTPAIAALEVLAHNPRIDLLRTSYVFIEIQLPAELILKLDLATLPKGWNKPQELGLTAGIGDRWLDSKASVALEVPSAVLPLESNLLLAPLHQEFSRIVAQDPVPFAFDYRLT